MYRNINEVIARSANQWHFIDPFWFVAQSEAEQQPGFRRRRHHLLLPFCVIGGDQWAVGMVCTHFLHLHRIRIQYHHRRLFIT